MTENVRNLIALIEAHPELPIVPMVDAEICGDDYGTYMGTWGASWVDEYLVAGDMVLFKSDDDVFDVLERVLSTSDFDSLPESEEECRPVYDALQWEKAIIVNISTL